MPEPIRVNRPSYPNHEQMPPMGGEQRMYEPQPGRGGSKMPWIVLVVVIVVLVLLAVIFRDNLFGKNTTDKGVTPGTKTTTPAKSSGYQAVFLTNGQVYFGKLSKGDTELPIMKEIYYLQVTQPPLQGSQQEGQQSAQQQAQPQLSLVKLGNELHGPVDEMVLNRDHILFWEDMKDDSQVVKAIADYIKSQANPPAGQTPAK